MEKILARNILAIPRLEIWNIPDVPYSIVYEDGKETESNKKHIIFNRYCWDMFITYPNTPIVGSCDIVHILNGEFYNADTHIKLLETIFKHICEYNNLHAYKDKEHLL